jgi:nicotinate-nucleotide adenylyltransferase
VVGLFGGSFNPPHAAHQLVALYALETLVDEIWFVPTYSHPFGKQLVAYEHRVAMCELASAPLGARARVSKAEQELANKPDFVASRTLDLIEHLLASFPGIALRLVGTMWWRRRR